MSKEKETSLIHFIFLSAKVEKDNIRHGMELGADDYLTKPFKIEELLNISMPSWVRDVNA